MDNRSRSQAYAEAGHDWVEKDSAARLLEDTKSLLMAQKQAALGDIPVNRAEQQIKSSPEWYDHVEKIVLARTVANAARVDMDVAYMRFQEQNSHEANARLEMKMVS
jgi:hypothetical protein